ncbi:nitric oxide synthase, salivary gland-like [Phymastichus coffea]|uniref:nitric oxide synthase, salivary gland-like n=1 Tax=Phymastichus coffea TaxID=108790 RepID=UPI00273C4EED|nr:nitric oxide synthase, salivary gland-like [Phymastichus coffea]
MEEEAQSDIEMLSDDDELINRAYHDYIQNKETEEVILGTSKSFIKLNSQTETRKPDKLNRLDSLRESLPDSQIEGTFGPLSNMQFAVFALGSSAYPNFCAFGRYVDNLLGELGGERLLNLFQGDEMCGQEQSFQKWATDVFNVSCETFCIDDEETLLEAAESLESDIISPLTVRFIKSQQQSLLKSLNKCHNRNIFSCNLIKKTDLSTERLSRSGKINN